MELIWYLFDKAIKPCETHNWYLEVSPEIYTHDSTRNHNILLMAFMAPKPTKSMTEIFHKK